MRQIAFLVTTVMFVNTAVRGDHAECFTGAFLTVPFFAQQQPPAYEPLTNERVIRLIRSGVSTDELTLIITTAPQVGFDLTPAGTTTLSQAGVPDGVIKAMAARMNPVTATVPGPPAPESASKPGDGNISRREKSNDTLSITSLPDGAKVEWNRKVIGTTPLTYKVGEYAFNARKTSLFSKRLEQPVVLRISKEGYVTREITITQEMFWQSLNGSSRFTFHVITSNSFEIDLDKISAAKAALTNADVIKLKAAGFGDDLIIDKINTNPAAFHLEFDDLVELHKAGLSDVIIQAMMHAK
jgi:hypothetical protein